MKNQTPDYVKRNSIISGILIAPFFIFVIVNDLDNHKLPSTPGWNVLYLSMILGLPVAAMILSVVTWVKLAWSDKKRRSFLNLRLSWPIITTTVLALIIVLFVPFHDSTHCVAGNPIKEARNFDQTWHCVWRG
ncbi:MAG TPA: hypothetical protein VFP32_00780 [Candidatus Saccharimonadales bacterium]|nr:hypothetical protein [Candidatus Saccharimonadales bacterium]